MPDRPDDTPQLVIELTDEQTKQIQDATGQQITALKLIDPLDASTVGGLIFGDFS